MSVRTKYPLRKHSSIAPAVPVFHGSSIIPSCIRRSRPCRITGNKLRVEEMLFSSGLDVTILQPTAYMQNILAEWDRMVGSGILPRTLPGRKRG